jgi:hypothetical protein
LGGVFGIFGGFRMKLAIVGSRTFDSFELLNEVVCTFFIDPCLQEYKVDTVISGGAPGADSIAKRWALISSPEGIQYTEFPADWIKYGKYAGVRRNQQIVDACDIVLAFWDGKSKGTQDTINKAKKAKKPTFIIYF